jgi:hypothetical protein
MVLTKKYISLVILGVIVGGVFSVLTIKNKAQRRPANIINPRGHQDLFEIKIYSTQQLPENEDQDVKIKAKVQPKQKLNSEIYYNWILPKDVVLVDGELSDSVPGKMLTQESFEIEITLQGISQSMQPPISLQVYTEIGDIRHGNSESYNNKQ